MNIRTLLAALVACVALQSAVMAQRPFSRVMGLTPATRGDAWAQKSAAGQAWHGQYYYLPYGQPTALVVPPTSMMQQNYSWGVSQNTMTPIHHQFGAAAVPSAGGAFLATPRWPSNTNQFGIYPVRAPW
jgi:hypothetical protein